MLNQLLAFSIFCLATATSLSGERQALTLIGRLEGEERIRKGLLFSLLRGQLSFLFGKHLWQGLLSSLSVIRHIFRLLFALSAFASFLPFQDHSLFSISALILFSSLLCDFLAHLLVERAPKVALKLFSPLSALALLLLSPFSALLYKLSRAWATSREGKKTLLGDIRMRDRVSELLQDTQLGSYLDANEQKLILSVVSFKERIAREVMVPRIDVFSLSSDSTLEEAIQSFLKEEYSRIPVYKDSVDNIIGVLIYKDILKLLTSQTAKSVSPTSISSLVKPVLYTPETKKLSQLLQEFRSKQIHLAIVVDEYGGTEGIVTIEDILEELVGEIADEYDIRPQDLFTTLPAGGWIVDAKMSIIDIEEELGVKIPQGPEYDTIGGYIFQRAGSIPSKGWKIHHDDFDLEVLSSTERAVEKIRITPHRTAES